MAPHKHNAFCTHLHAFFQRFLEANPPRIANSSPPQQPQSQQQQPRGISPQSTAFVPESAWRQLGSHTSSQPAPPRPPTPSTAQPILAKQPDTAPQAPPRPSNAASSHPPLTSDNSSGMHRWAEFKTHIKADDKGMVRKAREGVVKHGEEFWPELRETYDDRKGGGRLL